MLKRKILQIWIIIEILRYKMIARNLSNYFFKWIFIGNNENIIKIYFRYISFYNLQEFKLTTNDINFLMKLWSEEELIGKMIIIFKIGKEKLYNKFI